MMADSKVPNGTVPIGFYVHPTGTPSDIHIYNTDAHRNYVGYRFDGTPTAIELKNCRAYANRTYGLMDNTGRGDIFVLSFLREQPGDWNFDGCYGNAGADQWRK